MSTIEKGDPMWRDTAQCTTTDWNGHTLEAYYDADLPMNFYAAMCQAVIHTIQHIKFSGKIIRIPLEGLYDVAPYDSKVTVPVYDAEGPVIGVNVYGWRAIGKD